jgi:lysine 2,3-aminomutase
MRALHGRLSGLCQPTYVLDIPGGHGKAPIGPSYLERTQGSEGADCKLIEEFRGGPHADAPHPPAAAPSCGQGDLQHD